MEKDLEIDGTVTDKSNDMFEAHTGTAYAKNGDYILGVVFHPKPSSVSDVAGVQSVHAGLN